MTAKDERNYEREKRMSDDVTTAPSKKTKIDDHAPSTSRSSSHTKSQLTLKETFKLKKTWDINSSQANQFTMQSER